MCALALLVALRVEKVYEKDDNQEVIFAFEISVSDFLIASSDGDYLIYPTRKYVITYSVYKCLTQTSCMVHFYWFRMTICRLDVRMWSHIYLPGSIIYAFLW